ncbi:hypothetical protein [Flavobacterium sp. MDT1-60]|uniref:hypothetical protein n=1 Tax=Flavobacterium sp. MDT1-60 TaxID=1979344 RepID=UPI00177BFA51|nr:hypothetical protein [Flavobacterium sp. MDT1-60]QOG02386.1 hypothetical protein IHE43_21820 [Flavobacterium sp. MDT1-60]
MKCKFLILMIALLLMQSNIYAQRKDNTSSDKIISSQKNDDEKMFKYLNLSEEQIVKMQAIRKNGKANWKVLKDVPEAQNSLVLNMATTQDSIDNLLSPIQKVKMRKFEMKENYTSGLKQKINLSQNQEEQIESICEQSFDKQQTIINSSSTSDEDIKQQIGKLNTETSDKIAKLLTVKQKRQLETGKEN